MAEVSITIAGRAYDLFCEDGEETELRRLAAIVEAKAIQAQDLVGSASEARTLLFAALFLADDAGSAQKPAVASPTPQPAMPSEDDIKPMAQALERLANRIEGIASTFDQF